MLKRKLSDLFEEMYHGKYVFADFVSGDIAANYAVFTRDRTVGSRTFFSPNKKLRAFHTFLNLFVFEFLPINENVVYSYRKGFSVYDAVSRHAGSKYFFQTDIQSFFSNVSSDLIRNTLNSGLYLCPVSDLENYIDRILDLVCIDNSLPVGFPSSAPISNAVLLNFDNELEKLCASLNVIYTRYSDDIIISSNEKSSLADIDTHIERILQTSTSGNLKLNNKKSKFFQVGGKIKILGMMILPNGKITIDTAIKKDLELLLHNYTANRPKFLEIIKTDEDSALGRITGYLNYANSIDQEYLDKLRKKYGATTIDTLLHRPLPKSNSKQ